MQLVIPAADSYSQLVLAGLFDGHESFPAYDIADPLKIDDLKYFFLNPLPRGPAFQAKPKFRDGIRMMRHSVGDATVFTSSDPEDREYVQAPARTLHRKTVLKGNAFEVTLTEGPPKQRPLRRYTPKPKRIGAARRLRVQKERANGIT